MIEKESGVFRADMGGDGKFVAKQGGGPELSAEAMARAEERDRRVREAMTAARAVVALRHHAHADGDAHRPDCHDGDGDDAPAGAYGGEGSTVMDMAQGFSRMVSGHVV